MSAIARLIAVLLAVLGLHSAGATTTLHMGGRPFTVHSIQIRSASGLNANVTRPAAVQQIVEWFDALPPFVPRPCPYAGYEPPDVRFVFRLASGGVVLRAVDHAPGTCQGSISFSNDGQVKYAPLADDNFVARVSKLLGLYTPSPTLTNERLAKRDAPHLLQLAVVPPASRRVATLIESDGTPEHCSPSAKTTGSDVSICRLWKAPVSLRAFLAFERAHRPAGSRLAFAGKELWRAHGPSSRLNVAEHLTFSFPAFPHRVSTRALYVTGVALAHGWTGISVRAEDTWVVARPPGEVVPSGIQTIEIRKDSVLVHHVTSPGEVATIIRWFDALPLPPMGGPDACDGTEGPIPGAATERIAFLDRSGRVLARATEFPYGGSMNPCFPIRFAVGRHRFPSLLDGGFLMRVERLLSK